MMHFTTASLYLLACLQLPLATAAPGSGVTLQNTALFIRAVTDPNFHKYLQSDPVDGPGPALMDDRRKAGKFIIDSSGQLFDEKKQIYLTVASEKSHGGQTLATSFASSPNKLGKFAWSGDTLLWSGPIKRQQDNAWLICERKLYINLGNWNSKPAGCASHTIHYNKVADR